MEPVKRKLGERLQALRGEMSLYRLEKECGIPRPMLQRYESGENLPENESLKKLATFFQVEFRELKKLFFEDLYPPRSQDREILLEWLADHAIEPT